MMKSTKSAIALFLSIAIFLVTATTATAWSNSGYMSMDEDDLADFVISQINETYGEYYSVSNISIETESVENAGSNIKVILFASFDRTLLADTASDLPYVRGLDDALSTVGQRTQTAYHQILERQVSAAKQDIEDNYIGVAQYTTARYLVTIPVSSTNLSTKYPDYNIEYVFYEDIIPISEIAPVSDAEMYLNGQQHVTRQNERLQQANTSSLILRSGYNPSGATDYDRIVARDYAREHAQNYNTDYVSYSKDCANFVSQAIHDGGIQMVNGASVPLNDRWIGASTWSTDTWGNTGYDRYGLTDYMVDNGFFFNSTDRYSACAGSILVWTSRSHVGMVDANDTITMTYCAHTNDASSQPIPSSGVKFCIPVWDSYNGEYLN